MPFFITSTRAILGLPLPFLFIFLESTHSSFLTVILITPYKLSEKNSIVLAINKKKKKEITTLYPEWGLI